MCTVVILRRATHPWPILIAANRDEMIDRPWDPPARHWSDREDVIGGRDRLAGGTWLAMNDSGVVAAILNRRNSLGPAEGFRSRGELPLDAVDFADAKDAAEALSAIDPRAYRPFNMVIADNRDAYWLRATGEAVEAMELPEGISMVTAYDRNDTASARVQTYLPRFEKAATPDPETGDWAAWEHLMASRVHETGVDLQSESGPAGAMAVVTDIGFGTVSSSLIALPAMDRPTTKP
ncbi:MAG: NRDE family protein, partial [Rhodospirillales bacterium]|nr:NRDE family protein [Rhodospirillales bacterium]